MLDVIQTAIRRLLPRNVVLGMNERNRRFIARHNPRKRRSLADDKVLAKHVMGEAGIPIPATYAVVDAFRSIPAAIKQLARCDDFVVKPARGHGGIGIVIVTHRRGGVWIDASGQRWDRGSLSRRIGRMVLGDYTGDVPDSALIEERLKPGPVLAALPALGLPDIRIITLNSRIIMGMVRIPTRCSKGCANLHQGGVGLGVDLERGTTTHAIWRGQRIQHHPDTKQNLIGLRVNAWPSVLAVADRTARAFPLGYLGIDVAVTEDESPVVLEVNVRPGLEIQNANARGLRSDLHSADLAGVRP